MVTKITRAPNRRVHALRPEDWGQAAATDYWANFNNSDQADAAGADLDAAGWTTSGYAYLIGSGADFLTSVDVGVPGGLDFNVTSDHIRSPFIFGDYAHGQLAAQLLGYDPTTLTMECYARFAVNNNEQETGFGFVENASAESKELKEHTTGEVAEMAGCTREGVRKAIRTGRLRARRVGRMSFIREEDALAFVRTREDALHHA